VAEQTPEGGSRHFLIPKALTGVISTPLRAIRRRLASFPFSAKIDQSSMITKHLIPQAHLDLIWLWPWTAGLDEAKATCRTACDRLDRNPDLTFNLGEAWVLEQIELTDPGTRGMPARRIRGQK
jgi:hypothetical protein